MLNPATLQLFSTVSFDLHPASVLGNGFKNAKLMAIIDADTARLFIDPAAMHANVYPFLPPGTPNNYKDYPYLKFKLASGGDLVLGLPWIKDETWQVTTTRSMRLTIENVSPADQNRVIEALSANGFTAVDVQFL